MSFLVVSGILLVLCLIICVGIFSGQKVKKSSDFLTGGGQASSFLVCGSILGSLVSSQATIGTAQLAFHYGLAAWWFTLGSGLGCLVLALGYTRPLRRSGCITELQIISQEYGASAGSIGSILCSIGIFISILAQTAACVGLITVLFPGISSPIAAVISVLIMGVYVIFGGAWGAGMGGVVKLLLLCITSMVGCIYVMVSCGGVSGIFEQLSSLFLHTDLGGIQMAANGLKDLSSELDISQRFSNPIARGAMKDIGSGLSLLLGVLSTQTYAQAIWSAKSDTAAKRGALISACLIPPIGICGICIGLFMRTHYILQAEADTLTALGRLLPELPVLESTIQVFPAFVLNHLPPLAAGMILGTLLITVIGGAAGLSLGMASILLKDVFKNICRCHKISELRFVRLIIAGILTLAAMITILIPTGTINDLGFLSMGLRGSIVFLPLLCALWFPGKVSKRGILRSMILSPMSIFIAKIIAIPIDALFVGVLVSTLCCVVGMRKALRC